MNLTKEQALAKIEELKKYVEAEEAKPKGVAIYSRYDGITIIYQSSKDTIKEAVEEAVAKGASLTDASLTGADLTGADLRGAYLGGAYLRDAYLRDADLRGAYLRGAELAGAKFYGKGGTKKLLRSQLPDFLAALGFVIEEDGVK